MEYKLCEFMQIVTISMSKNFETAEIGLEKFALMDSWWNVLVRGVLNRTFLVELYHSGRVNPEDTLPKK